ncbi:MAG: Uma2 family endonuclease [Candidatus Binatia bacterium]
MLAGSAIARDTRLDRAAFRRWLTRRPASDLNHYELLDGRIVMTPPAGWPHGRIDATLAHLLRAHVAQHHLGIVLGSSTGYDLPSGDTVEPDVSFISSAQFAAGPSPTRGRFLHIVPTLIVEILAPSTAPGVSGETKLSCSSRAGVGPQDRRVPTVLAGAVLPTRRSQPSSLSSVHPSNAAS